MLEKKRVPRSELERTIAALIVKVFSDYTKVPIMALAGRVDHNFLLEDGNQ